MINLKVYDVCVSLPSALLLKGHKTPAPTSIHLEFVKETKFLRVIEGLPATVFPLKNSHFGTIPGDFIPIGVAASSLSAPSGGDFIMPWRENRLCRTQ
ncbi:hypothetical protein [Oryzifoliimicrobium ureilyticus]|uniref:hypothetical protein n=1 Tax=Oryzifoliimicrobium ureilyticus TaxID=3113724 RepID=UPI0030760087